MWELDDQTMRGSIPWSGEGLLEVLGGGYGMETGKIVRRLVDRHGRRQGEAYVVRLAAVGHFLEQNREHLLRAKLMEERPDGDFLTAGLAEALATSSFDRQIPGSSGDEPQWDFDPMTIFRTAHAFNSKLSR